jgi:MFS family permease
MTNKRNYFTGLTKNTFLLAFTSFFADISTEMLYPVLPIFLTQTLQANASVLGIVEGVATATQNIVQGFSGWLADKFQKRKGIALFGYSLAALSKPLIGIALVWQTVLATRFLDRFGTGMRSAPRDALIAASAGETNRGKAFGLEGFGDNLGAFVGPLLAMLLLFTFHVGIRDIFYFAFIPGFLAVCMILLVKEKHIVVSAKSKIDLSFKNFPASYWRYIGVTALFGIGNSSTSFLILQTKNIGVPFAITILIYAFFNLVAALISYPAGSLSDKFGRKSILLLSFIIFLLTYLGFATSKNIYLICFLFILYGLFQGIFRAVGKALAADFVPQELRASGIGWYSTTVGLSSLVASIIGGQLWVLINPSATFLYGAAFAVLGSIGLLVFIPKPSSSWA